MVCKEEGLVGGTLTTIFIGMYLCSILQKVFKLVESTTMKSEIEFEIL